MNETARPMEKLQPGEPELMRDYLDAGLVNIVQLIYQQRAYEGQARTTIYRPIP